MFILVLFSAHQISIEFMFEERAHFAVNEKKKTFPLSPFVIVLMYSVMLWVENRSIQTASSSSSVRKSRGRNATQGHRVLRGCVRVTVSVYLCVNGRGSTLDVQRRESGKSSFSFRFGVTHVFLTYFLFLFFHLRVYLYIGENFLLIRMFRISSTFMLK